MQFVKRSPDGYRETVPGVVMRPLAHGDRTNMVENHVKGGSVHRHHSHPYEQAGYLLSGRTRLTIEDQQYEVEPGDSWCVPANAVHQMEIFEDSVIVEVFSPVREEYL
ncbi:MAG: cupin domain-containing protein [Chloroflexota bacterium]